MFKKFYATLVYVGNALQSLFLLGVRLFWGYQFFQTGRGKLLNIEKIATYFDSLNIPFPAVNAYIAGTIECLGGLCLIFGFASRFASLPLICVMCVAFMTADFEALRGAFEEPSKLLSSTPFTFLLAALIIFVFGPGNYSIDRLLERFFGKKNNL